MKLDLSTPILYLITRGETAETTTAESSAFLKILNQVSAAVAAGIDLIQIREKKLSARALFELTERAVELTAGKRTRIIVNDRADIAAGTGAAGVHLTTRSIDAATIRKTFGEDFLIGASTHSLDEARAARDGGADFAVFGPIFETTSKPEYGPPLGLEALTEAARELAPFPLLALGGISVENAHECLRAGASGIAGISLFADPVKLKSNLHSMRSGFAKIFRYSPESRGRTRL
jgi:thiamine-phosphate pyrophosphorylase